MIQVFSDSDFRAEQAAKALCDRVGPLLARAYPGYRWRVEPGEGIVDIRCEMTNARYGYTLKLSRYYSSSDFDRQVLRAGGEILERFRMSRRGFHEQDLLHRSRNIAGQLIPDL